MTRVSYFLCSNLFSLFYLFSHSHYTILIQKRNWFESVNKNWFESVNKNAFLKMLCFYFLEKWGWKISTLSVDECIHYSKTRQKTWIMNTIYKNIIHKFEQIWTLGLGYHINTPAHSHVRERAHTYAYVDTHKHSRTHMYIHGYVLTIHIYIGLLYIWYTF